jgi:hypothetical protein
MSATGHSATPTLADRGMIQDHAGNPCRYLTDGVNLYRYVGTIPGSMGRMIGLEDCHSLDLVLWRDRRAAHAAATQRHSGHHVARVSRRCLAGGLASIRPQPLVNAAAGTLTRRTSLTAVWSGRATILWAPPS